MRKCAANKMLNASGVRYHSVEPTLQGLDVNTTPGPPLGGGGGGVLAGAMGGGLGGGFA